MIQRFFNYLLKNQLLLVLVLIVLGWLIIQIRDIITSLFLSYIIMAAVLPLVNFLRKKKFPKIVAVLIPYSAIIIAVTLLIIPLVPFVSAQIQSLAKGFPQYLDKSAAIVGFKIDPKQVNTYLTNELSSIGQDAVTVTGKVFGGFFSILTVFIISFYLLMYQDEFKKSFAALFHRDSRKSVLETMDKVNEKLGAWLRGQIILCLFIGVMTWVGLVLIGIPYPLPLALIAGMLEVVPTLGPIMSAVPAVVVALTVSPTLALIVVAMYIVIQALENHILVPNIMQKAVGLNPIIVILGITIGANLMGIPGALLSIPFISFIIVLFNSIEQRNN
jgi:predicted PurR-regulated permease PerM